MIEKHKKYMKEALKQGILGAKKNCIPIGCVLVENNKIIAKSHNGKFWHAEILCIQKAQKKLGKYLNNTTMFVTVQPCAMCMHAIRLSRIPCVFFASANELKPLPQTEILQGPYEEDASELMQNFFKSKRKAKPMPICIAALESNK